MSASSTIKPHELSIHVTRPGSSTYAAGRRLSAEVYRTVWHTRSLTDDHTLGVVVLVGERAVGNVNLQLHAEGRALPSERYFAPHHWRACFDVAREQVGEVAALAIDDGLDFATRELTLIGLMYGLCVGGRMLGLRLLSTVEHRALARRMKGYLGLPLRRNEQIVQPSDDTPDDVYWRGKDRPELYYIDMLDPLLVRTTGVIHAYLASKHVPLQLPLTNSDTCNFARFSRELSEAQSATARCASRGNAA